jgi:hypothetical protein
MGAIYATGEFKDNYNNDWKVDIYDTTYGGLPSTFTLADSGFIRNYDGIDDEPLFTPVYASNVTVRMMIKSTETAMLALIADFPEGKEDQYYILIYKNTNLWFAGMILTDTSQFTDENTFIYELNARDGLNRLENFDYPIDDITTDWVTEKDAILYALQICGLERFYALGEEYLSISVNWWDVNGERVYSPLEETRISKQSFIEDIEENTPKRALKAIEDILQTYGATIRFEEGRFRISQLESFLTDTTTWEDYDKAGTFIGTSTQSNEVEIGVDDNNTNDQIVNMYLPSLYGVGEQVTGVSEYRWGVNEAVTGTPWTLSDSFIVDSVGDLILTVDLTFTPLISGPGALTRAYFEIEREGYKYVTRINASGVPYYPRLWVSNADYAAGGYSNLWCDFYPMDLIPITQKITITIPFTFPLVPSVGDTLIITTAVSDLIVGTGVDWVSNYHSIAALENGKSEKEFSYVATNTNYNSASVFAEKTVAYCDWDIPFALNNKQIFDGTNWINSTEWASGNVAVTGIPLAQLLCEKAVYFQRYPRLLIQGNFILPTYNSNLILVWRSRRFVFLNGSLDANSCTWNGTLMELIEQTTDITSGVRNPYRDKLVQIYGDVSNLMVSTTQTNTDVAVLNSEVFYLKRASVIEEITSTRTILPEESNTRFTNNGASDDVTFTLPAIQVGLKYHFTSTEAPDTSHLIVTTSDTITYKGEIGDTMELNGKASFTIEALTLTEWFVTSFEHSDKIKLT